MLQYRIIIVYLFISFAFVPFASAASQTIIKVVDQNQKPLANAVVEYFSNKDNNEVNKPSIKKSIKTSTQASKKDDNNIYIMDQIQKSFVPEVLVVPKNSLVSFPNSDDLRHHVYSFSAAKTFELKLYAGKPKSPLLFPTEGVVVLGCNIHDAMVGYIYVSDQEAVYTSDKNGLITIKQPLSELTQLQIWHPNATEGVDYRKLYARSQLVLADDIVTITVNINEPAARDSFEDQF